MPMPEPKQTAVAVNQEMNRPVPQEQQANPKEAGKGGGIDTKEKAEQYHQLLDNISKMIDGEKGLEEGHDRLMQMLQQQQDNPPAALADATLAVGDSVLKHAQDAGVELTDDLLIAAAMDTIMSLAELAEAAGFFQTSEEDFANAYALTLAKWMKAHPDLVDWEGLNQSLQNADPQAVEAAHAMYGSDPRQSVAEAQEREQGAPRQQQPQQQPPGQGIISGGM